MIVLSYVPQTCADKRCDHRNEFVRSDATDDHHLLKFCQSLIPRCRQCLKMRFSMVVQGMPIVNVALKIFQQAYSENIMIFSTLMNYKIRESLVKTAYPSTAAKCRPFDTNDRPRPKTPLLANRHQDSLCHFLVQHRQLAETWIRFSAIYSGPWIVKAYNASSFSFLSLNTKNYGLTLD